MRALKGNAQSSRDWNSFASIALNSERFQPACSKHRTKKRNAQPSYWTGFNGPQYPAHEE